MVSESVFPTMKSQGAAKNEANNAAQSGAAAPAETKVAEKVDFSNVKIEPIFEEMVDFDTFAKSDFRAVKILECEAVPKSKKLLTVCYWMTETRIGSRDFKWYSRSITSRKNWLVRQQSLSLTCHRER